MGWMLLGTAGLHSQVVERRPPDGGGLIGPAARGYLLDVPTKPVYDPPGPSEGAPRTAATTQLIASRRHLPDVDPKALRRDLDELLDAEP
jgi:hypothetical protein